MPEDFPGPEGSDPLQDPPSFFSSEFGDGRPSGNFGQLVEVEVEGVFQTNDDRDPAPFVLLSDGVRKLPIMIGFAEAHAITMPLENKENRRPMTHDLCRSIIERLGADIDRVVIDDYFRGVYYAKMVLMANGQEIELDARPSDAMALALRFDAPIYLAEGIFDISPIED